MDSSGRELKDEVYGYIKIYSDGTVERPPFPGGYLPPCSSFVKGIASKDVIIHPHHGLWARLFLPESVASSQRRVPVVLHFHGGGLCTGSAAAASFHKFCSRMAIDSESIWVSVDYRLAPEHCLPAAYDDGLTAFLWLCSQAGMQNPQAHEKTVMPMSVNSEQNALGPSVKGITTGHDIVALDDREQALTMAAGQKAEKHLSAFGHDINAHKFVVHGADGDVHTSSEQWLYRYADFSNCFLAGESSGGAIVHYLTMRLTHIDYRYVQIKGLMLIHSAFLVEGLYDTSLNPRFERRPDTYRWLCLPVGAPGNHPLVNPLHVEAPSFKGIILPPAVVAVTDQDRFYEPCLRYVQVMKQHGHLAEMHITEGEIHCFYLYRPRSKKAELFYKNLAAFIQRQCQPQQSRSLL